jgi:hypothetical protein
MVVRGRSGSGGWPEPAPGISLSLSPGSGPAAKQETRAPIAAIRDLRANFRPLPDGRESPDSGNCPSICPPEQRGPRFRVRSKPLTWSPLTESNRRPSPYHLDAPGFTGDDTVVDREHPTDECAESGHGGLETRLGQTWLVCSGRLAQVGSPARSSPISEAGCRPFTSSPTVG